MAKSFMVGNILKKLYRRWRYLKSVGVLYPIFLVKRTAFVRDIDCGFLSKFGGHGLEIGGPSQFFRGGNEFPIYSVADQIDNTNFSHRTFWEGALEEGRNFRYNANKTPGYQFISEATDLSAVPACSYDFVASCHTLEHSANPIKALNEWRRVLKSDGWLALVLPHKTGTFDHRRRVTEFEHLMKDYSNAVTEDDDSHFAEILEKHDLDRDPAQESRNHFEMWIRNNSVNRGAHHHVFDSALAIRLVDHVGFEVIAARALMPFHIFIVAQKSDKSGAEKAIGCRQLLEVCLGTSPFTSDRRL
jgi:SAM-dependent methyltransferase